MKVFCALLSFLVLAVNTYGWGFFGHTIINYRAVFLLPPEMMIFYKSNIDFIAAHAVDPDKRRYAVEQEAPRHYIDLDKYNGKIVPRTWRKAVDELTLDTLTAHGIVPWWIDVMVNRLTAAFKEKNAGKILKLSAELGHYVADAHVPLHTSSNHNGQFTNQHGIHGFWESRVPELFAEKEWDLLGEPAVYIKNPLDVAWQTVHESFAACDSVLKFEKELNDRTESDKKYAHENRNGQLVKQYSTAYASKYNDMLDGMIERRMRQSINTVAALWFTAWVNAGKPDLKKLGGFQLDEAEKLELEQLEKDWKAGKQQGRGC